MTSPILPLRAAIRTACLTDATLASLMGGDVRIHDEPPRNAPPLACAFGDGEARDWSTGTDRGHEGETTLVVWARSGHAAGALAVADRLATLLDDAPLALAGHRLVLIRVTGTEVRRERETNAVRAVVTLRSLTEVA